MIVHRFPTLPPAPLVSALERRGMSTVGARQALEGVPLVSQADRKLIAQIVQQEATRGIDCRLLLSAGLPFGLVSGGNGLLSAAGVSAIGVQQFYAGLAIIDELDRRQVGAVIFAMLGLELAGGLEYAIAALRRGRRRAYGATGSVPIPDNSPIGASLSITIPLSFFLRALSTTVEINHPYRGDLVVSLKKDSQVVKLLCDRSGGSSQNLNETFELTEAELKNFSSAGTWSLRAEDTAAQDIGHIVSFELDFLS